MTYIRRVRCEHNREHEYEEQVERDTVYDGAVPADY